MVHAVTMDITFDLSSKLENRIDHELFQDDSEDFPIPGMSRRASMTQSMSEMSGLMQPPTPNIHDLSDQKLDTSLSRRKEIQENQFDNLNEQLLDQSDSMDAPPLPAPKPDVSASHDLANENEEGQHTSLDTISFESPPLNGLESDHSSSSISMPPSPSESCAPNASSSNASFRRNQKTGSIPGSPVVVNNTIQTATTPLQPPAPGRTAFTAATTAIQTSFREESMTSRLSGASTHSEQHHEPTSTSSSSTDEPSIAQLVASTSNMPHEHIDPKRLMAYQHQMNERLTQENEILKVQCEELMKIMQKHDKQKEEDDRAQLVKQIEGLNAVIESQQTDMARIKEEASHDTPSEYDPLLTKIRCALTQGNAEVMHSCIKELQEAVPGMDTSVDPDMLRPSESLLLSRSSSSWRHSTPHRSHAMESLCRSVASMSVVQDASRVTTDLKQMQQTVRTLTQELHETRTQLEAALTQSTDANASKLRIEARLASAVDELADVKESLDKRHKQCQELESLQQSLPRPDTSLDQSLQKARADLAAAHALQQQAQQQQTLLQEHLRLAGERYDRACAEADSARHARMECETQIDEQLLQLHSLQNLLAEQHAELGQLRGEKDHMWMERREIMEQLNVFEQRLRDVRTETEQYGSDLRALQQKEDMLAMRARQMDEECARLVRKYMADVLSEWQPRLDGLKEQCRALIFQKAYLSRALHSQTWLADRVRLHMHILAPTLRRYVPGYEPWPPRKRRSWRAAVRAVQFVIRLRHVD